MGNWLQEYINKTLINLIDGRLLGTKDFSNKIVDLDILMSNNNINFVDNKYGIYIPWDELLTRINYQWFSYLTVEEVLNCNNNLGKLILLGNQI